MELRPVGEVVLRSKISSLMCLTPSIPLRCKFVMQKGLHQPYKKQLRRSFTSSARLASRFPSFTTSASKPTDDLDEDTSVQPSMALDWLTAGIKPSGTSRFSSAGEQSNNLATSSNASLDELLLNKGSSATDLLYAYKTERLQSSSPSRSFDIDRMAVPKPKYGTPNKLMEDISREISAAPLPPTRVPMRLTPSTGRTIHVTGDLDLARGFKLLDQTCRRNKVRQTEALQRFHERPGLKRKRLKSQRWRKRFMLGFKATVNRVKALKKQGW